MRHVVTYKPVLTGRTLMYEAECGCGWDYIDFGANAVYEAAMEHGEFA